MKPIRKFYKTGLAAIFAATLCMNVSAQRHLGGGDRGGNDHSAAPSRSSSGAQTDRPERHEITRTEAPRNNGGLSPRNEGTHTSPPIVNQAPSQETPRRQYRLNSTQHQAGQNAPQQQGTPQTTVSPVAHNNSATHNNNNTAENRGGLAQRAERPNDFRPVNNTTTVNNYNYRSYERGGANYTRYNYNHYDRGYGFNHYNRNTVVVNRFYYGGGYHPHPYYYRPFVEPHWGLRIDILPFGYYPFYIGPARFFYNDGLFYQPYGGYYETIEPPLGAYVPAIPLRAYPIVIANSNYYEYNGTYYRRVYDSPQPYEVVGINGLLKSDLPAETDDILSDASISGTSTNTVTAPKDLTELPANFKKVTLNNILYYVSPAGEYYTKNIDDNGKVTYTVAAVETGGN